MSESVVAPAAGPPHSATPVQPPSSTTIGAGRKSYDLFDEPADILKNWPLLDDVLRTCERVIGPAFVRSDRLAWFFQKPHHWVTGVGALMATAAVLFAIFQLAFPELVERSTLPTLEVFSAITPRRSCCSHPSWH